MSQHFGQSTGFIILDIHEGAITAQEFRSTDRTPHEQALCGHQQSEAPSGGNTVFTLLSDCVAVLCGGMGAGAAAALRRQGIEPVVLENNGLLQDVVSAYLSGTRGRSQYLCDCHH
jgi:predicted Fe-Mo cluster-binding NifX family protein